MATADHTMNQEQVSSQSEASWEVFDDHKTTEEPEESAIIEVDVDTTYPNDAWEERYKKEFPNARTLKAKSLFMSDPSSSKNTIRFVCLSDTHSKVENKDFISRVPDGDVLLHAGDFTMYSQVDEYVAFNHFLEKLPHKIKLAIPGNHELDLDPRGLGKNHRKIRSHLGLPPVVHQNVKESIQDTKSLVSEARILIDEMVDVCGIKIYGLPWLPQYGLYGFGLSRGIPLLKRYSRCPANIDILLSHGPALGFGDFIIRRKHVGCVELLNSITKRIKPKYVISGHIHEDYGIRTDGVRMYINCASCNGNYRPVHDPVVFDYLIPEPYTREDFELLTQQDLVVTQPWRKDLSGVENED
ncbi:metallophosphoesterase domain-containing protein 1 [Elysia marginata]|uniref:Metallophosphoesterase domain-containing protein 1 n=1 Tax=Elysia marginata TaxID=1093978 RepID=A0AAV4J507_9GAST|nr:metallophosphoesterase domain-containing protein 1 [Elysia marginata]